MTEAQYKGRIVKGNYYGHEFTGIVVMVEPSWTEKGGVHFYVGPLDGQTLPMREGSEAYFLDSVKPKTDEQGNTHGHCRGATFVIQKR